MEQLVRVRAAHRDGTATVIHVRESACSGDCHKCSGCGAAKEALVFRADNPIGARMGDLVKVEAETAPVLKAAVVLYVIPLALFFLGYYLGTVLAWLPALTACAGFALGVAIVVFYDRAVASRAETRYTITTFVESMKREEHDHG